MENQMLERLLVLDQEFRRTAMAVGYLKASVQFMAGFMVGESQRDGKLKFEKWQLISRQVVENAARITEGAEPIEINWHNSLGDKI